jgi:hypothetical protein
MVVKINAVAGTATPSLEESAPSGIKNAATSRSPAAMDLVNRYAPIFHP